MTKHSWIRKLFARAWLRCQLGDEGLAEESSQA